jgi:hypothetical protein
MKFWIFAALVDDPLTHHFKSMDDDRTGRYYNERYRSHNCKISSLLCYGDEYGSRPVPKILQVSKESRDVGQKLFTLLPYYTYEQKVSPKLYFNTVYDNFYLGGSWLWKDFKVVADFLIKFHTTRPLHPTV